MGSLALFDLAMFLSVLSVLYGAYQFVWIKVHKLGYAKFGEPGEAFFDFLVRYYSDSLIWSMRRRYGSRSFYNGRMFLIFLKAKGVIFILLGISLGVSLFFAVGSEYGGVIKFPL